MEQISEQFKAAIENVAGQLYNATLKECKKAIRADGADYDSGYRDGLAAGKQKVLENFPAWRIAERDDYLKETCLAMAGEFGYRVIRRGQLIKEGWKYIPLKALKILPTLEDAGEEVEA